MFNRKRRSSGDGLRLDPAISGLRLRALTDSAEELGQSREDMPPVWLAVMEWIVRDSAVTLVSMNDGSTSLYFSYGGGVIGAGQHEPVAIASGQFLGACFLARDSFVSATEFDYPPPGLTRFYCRTDAGETLTAGAPESEIQQRDHPLFRPWGAAQAVITQIRLHTPEFGAGEPRPTAGE